MRFWKTVRRRARRGTWKVRPTPCAATASGRPSGRRRPFRRTSPASGASTPETTLSRVDLPEPLGPIRPVIGAALGREADLAQRAKAAERQADLSDLEHR